MSEFGAEVGSAYVRLRPDLRTFKAETEAGVSSAFSSAGRTAGKLLGGAFAATGVFEGLKHALEAATEHQAAFATLDKSLENAGLGSRGLAADLEKTLEAEARLKGFSDEDLASSMLRLVSVTKNVPRALADLRASEDLSRARHIQLAAAALALSKAEQGSTTALQRYGIVVPKVGLAQAALTAEHDRAVAAGVKFTGQTKIQYEAQLAAAAATDKQARIEEARRLILERFGGTANTFAKTASGQFQRLGQDVHQFEVAVVSAALPGITHVAESLGSFFAKAAESEQLRHGAVAVLHDLGEAAHVAGEALRVVGPVLGEVAGDAAKLTGAVGAPALLAAAGAYKAVGVAVSVYGVAQARLTALLAVGRGEETFKSLAAAKAATAEETAAAATVAYTAALAENTAALEANQGLAANAETKLADAAAAERQGAAAAASAVSTDRYTGALTENAAAARLNAAALAETDAALGASVEAKTADAEASARQGAAAALAAGDVSALAAAVSANEAALGRLGALSVSASADEARLATASAAAEGALAAQTAAVQAKSAALADLIAVLGAAAVGEERLAAASAAGLETRVAAPAAQATGALETGAAGEARLADAAAAEREAAVAAVADAATERYTAALASNTASLTAGVEAKTADAAASARQAEAATSAAAAVSATTRALAANDAALASNTAALAANRAAAAEVAAAPAARAETRIAGTAAASPAAARQGEAAAGAETETAALTGALSANASAAEADAAALASGAGAAEAGALRVAALRAEIQSNTAAVLENTGALAANRAAAAATGVGGAGIAEEAAAARAATAETAAYTGALSANVAAATAELEALAALAAAEAETTGSVAALSASLAASDAALAANTAALSENAGASAARLFAGGGTSRLTGDVAALGTVGPAARAAEGEVATLARTGEKAAFGFGTLARAAVGSVSPVTAVGIAAAGLVGTLIYLGTRESETERATRTFTTSLGLLADGINRAQDAASSLAQSRVDVSLARDSKLAADAAVRNAAAQEVSTRHTAQHAAAVLNLRTARDQDRAAVLAVSQAERAVTRDAASNLGAQRALAAERQSELEKAVDVVNKIHEGNAALARGRFGVDTSNPQRNRLFNQQVAAADRADAIKLAASLAKTASDLETKNPALAKSVSLLSRFIEDTKRLPTTAQVRFILNPANADASLKTVEAAIRRGALKIGADAGTAAGDGFGSTFAKAIAAGDVLDPLKAVAALVGNIFGGAGAAAAKKAEDAVVTAADQAIKTTRQKLDEVRSAAKEKIGQFNADLTALHDQLDQAIKQRQDDLTSAIQQAKSNLDAIGQQIVQDLDAIIDRPLQQAQERAAARQNQRGLEALRRTVSLPGGKQLSTDPQKALAQLEALQRQAGNSNRAAIQNFIDQYRSAILAVQGDQATALKERVQRQITDLTDLLNRNKISPTAFRKRLLADLRGDVGDYKKAGGQLGSAFQNALNDEVDAAIKQAGAVGAAPHRRGGGAQPQIIRPLETLHNDTREVARIQREIGNKQIAVQKAIHDETKKTNALLAQIAKQEAIRRHPTATAAVPGRGARTARESVKP